MPKLWRYLLSKYLQIFFLSSSSFIAILFVFRFKDIARFAAITANWGKTAQFMAYQIPAILPLALPISALIAALLLFQRLDRSHELTALRSSGMSLGTLFVPLFFASLLLSAFHFSLCSSLAPYCRRESRALLYRETSSNPFLLLENRRFLKIPNVFLKMKVREEGKTAIDFLLIAYNETSGRLSLISAKKLHLEGEKLIGEKVAYITEQNSSLLMENQGSMTMNAPLLSAAMKKNRPSLESTTLSLQMLRIKSLERGREARAAQVEILRRSSLSLFLFSLTWLGFAFGIELSRVPTKKGLFKASLLTLTVLVSYLLGRALKQDLMLAAGAYFLPHLLIWICTAVHLNRINQGKIR